MSPQPELTGVQKVAVVLMQMSHEASAKVMAHFTEAEAEDVAAEIMKMRSVNPDLAEKIMDEFHAIAVKGRVHARGGRDLAARMLEASFGAERAGNLMDRMDSTMAGKSFEFLDTVESAQILGMLDGELPETIALVLAHLRPASASGVMGGLSEMARADVAQAIATMGSATPEAVSIVSDVLKVRAGAVVTPRETVEIVGGVQPLVDIINRSDVATEKALLASLDERDPELAAEVRARMLTFADIVKLEARHIQQILRGIDVTILATAMKGASEPVLDAIRKNVSERNREILEAEIKNAGPVRMKQVEESRAEVVQAIRALEATGDISVRRSEDDEFVY
ncbi:MAG TPA: flagellar motor switch protein FliG [Arthrobacter sp.]